MKVHLHLRLSLQSCYFPQYFRGHCKGSSVKEQLKQNEFLIYAVLVQYSHWKILWSNCIIAIMELLPFLDPSVCVSSAFWPFGFPFGSCIASLTWCTWMDSLADRALVWHLIPLLLYLSELCIAAYFHSWPKTLSVTLSSCFFLQSILDQ